MSNHHEDSQLDDPQLTAYALGELHDAAARRVIDARLEREPALRVEVEQIRAVAAQLEQQLAAEPMPDAKPLIGPDVARVRGAKSRPGQRPRWAGRLAIAAAVSVVAGGITYSVVSGRLDRQESNASKVATNLRQVGGPLLLYSNDSRGAYPQSPQNGPTVGAPASSVSPSADAATPEGTPDFTNGPSFNLAQGQGQSQYGMFGGAVVTGAGAEQRAEVAARAPTPGQTATLGYSYQQPFPGTSPVGGGFKLNHAVEAEFGIVSDINPGSFNTEAYDRVVDNPFLDVVQNPLSTFSIDVDTASYSNVRRFLSRGQRPPKDAVRIEEMVNYFPYDYEPPAKDAKEPFATDVEVADCPWRPEHRLVRVAIKGKEIRADKRPASNLVFLLDVSGSMQPANRLPMVKRSMRMLLDQLNGEDRVAIVVYAGSSGLVLPSTQCSAGAKQGILHAIETLSAGGSTNGEQGIQLAYSVARQNFIEGGTNRVILCTDGDFNVGVTNEGDLTRLIEEKAKSGVFLSVLGYGMGNLKDSMMEKLADKGNGNYAYIDTIGEAKKVLVEQMSGTLVTIAKDVKIQVEFNPAAVASYRLIGYENRLLAKEDFNDDKKDAGEIGASHAVTALYEVVPAGTAAKGAADERPSVDPLKYQKPAQPAATATATTTTAAGGHSGELLTLKLRYKQPDGDTSALIETPVKDAGQTFAKASRDFKFASSVAAFGMILRESPHKGRATYGAVLEWAEDGLAGKDRSGYRNEFVELVKRAKGMAGE